jgi:hypothetical protein
MQLLPAQRPSQLNTIDAEPGRPRNAGAGITPLTSAGVRDELWKRRQRLFQRIRGHLELPASAAPG